MADRLKSLDRKRTNLTPGTVLVREWDRQSHRVMVLADGFAWNGQTYWSTGRERGAANYIDNLVSQQNGRFLAPWEGDMLKA